MTNSELAKLGELSARAGLPYNNPSARGGISYSMYNIGYYREQAYEEDRLRRIREAQERENNS